MRTSTSQSHKRHLLLPSPDYSPKAMPWRLGLGIRNPEATSVMGPLFDIGMVSALITKRQDYRTAHRRLEKKHRFTVLLDGEMTMEINETVHTINPGDLVFYPAGTMRSQSNPGNSMFLYLTLMEHPFWTPLAKKGCYIRPYESADLLYLLMMRIGEALETPTPLSLRFAEGDALTMTDLLRREVIMASHKSTKERPALRRLVEEIKKAPEKNWTLATMAEQTSVSPRTLTRQISADYGISPVDLVVRERMRYASLLLAESNMTIDAVAQAVGYESTSAFSHLFKKHFGRSPGKFRSDIRNPN